MNKNILIFIFALTVNGCKAPVMSLDPALLPTNTDNQSIEADCFYNNAEAVAESLNLLTCIEETKREENIKIQSIEIPWQELPLFAKVTTEKNIYYLSRNNYRQKWIILSIWNIACSFPLLEE